jgi:hypothetical protein
MARSQHFGHAAATLIRSVVLGRHCIGLRLAGFALVLTRAAAAFPTSRLVYARGPGAEQCPDQDAVRRAVTSRLGYDPFFPGSDKTIVARILRDSDRLKGEVELVDEHGVELGLREFSAESDKCADLIGAMALSISIAIDPKSAETYAKGPPDEAPASEDAPEPEPANPGPMDAPPAAPKPSAPPAAAPHLNLVAAPRATPSAVAWSAGVGLAGAFGSAPKPTLGALAFGAGRMGAWSLAFEVRADLPVTDEQKGATFRTTGYALSALPCFHVGFAFACELTQVGVIQATGTEPASHSGSSLLFSLGGRVGSELALTPALALVAWADLFANPWPVRLVAQGSGVWLTPTLAGDIGLATALHF